MRKIVQTVGICGGASRIDGTRISVWIIWSHQRFGMSPKRMSAAWPSISQEEIELALQYANEHLSEMYMAENENDHDL